MTSVQIPPEYGLIGIVVVLSGFVHMWMAMQVGKARKKYNVPYPNMYASESENPDAQAFNCVQRGHQNSLEMLPNFYVLLLLGGLQNPWISFGFGLVYIAARIVYFIGYSTGNPDNRIPGLTWAIGILGLTGTTLNFVVQSLMKIN